MQVITGEVVKGAQQGRALGYPTANIECSARDLGGVYAARVVLHDEASYQAAVFFDAKRHILEAHLLDFNDDLYGEEIEVTLLHKIRESEVLSDTKMLKTRIGQDVAKVREYFKN